MRLTPNIADTDRKGLINGRFEAWRRIVAGCDAKSVDASLSEAYHQSGFYDLDLRKSELAGGANEVFHAYGSSHRASFHEGKQVGSVSLGQMQTEVLKKQSLKVPVRG